eukprot:7969834-Lingulodinium_polyedra.AAC.1
MGAPAVAAEPTLRHALDTPANNLRTWYAALTEDMAAMNRHSEPVPKRHRFCRAARPGRSDG